MWSLFLYPYNWQSLLSPLLAVYFLLSFLQAGLLFYVVVKLKKANASDMRNAGMRDSLILKESSSAKVSFPQIDVRKVIAVVVIGVASAFILARLAARQRGFCIATGDYADSDHMTVLYKIAEHEWRVLGKDGNEYTFNICPTASFNLKDGAKIEFAHYEYRDGCADFTGREAKLKLERSTYAR